MHSSIVLVGTREVHARSGEDTPAMLVIVKSRMVYAESSLAAAAASKKRRPTKNAVERTRSLSLEHNLSRRPFRTCALAHSSGCAARCTCAPRLACSTLAERPLPPPMRWARRTFAGVAHGARILSTCAKRSWPASRPCSWDNRCRALGEGHLDQWKRREQWRRSI